MVSTPLLRHLGPALFVSDFLGCHLLKNYIHERDNARVADTNFLSDGLANVVVSKTYPADRAG
jgi:hypothetical protein